MVSQITDEAMIVCPNPSACLLLPSAYVLRNDGTNHFVSVCLYILRKFTVPVDFLQRWKYKRSMLGSLSMQILLQSLCLLLSVMKREEVK